MASMACTDTGTFVPGESRSFVPCATVSFRESGFWRRQRADSPDYPVMDISKTGLAFIANQPPRTRRISLQLAHASEGRPIALQCDVNYVIPNAAIHRRGFRVGVQFRPFSGKKGDNLPEALETLGRLDTARFHDAASPPAAAARLGVL